jgi:hypothetical protein
MRKLTTILALLGLAASINARSARADGVTYTVTSTYASNIPTTLVSAPNESFTFTFNVPSPCSLSSTPPCNLSMGVGDFPAGSINVTFSSPTLPPFTQPATLTFEPSSVFLGGLFDLEAVVGGAGGGDFLWVFTGPQIFNATPNEICFGPAGTFCTGPFLITGGTDFSGSFFFNMNDATMAGDLTGGSGTGTSTVAAPEPSSLLLLGSGFLALGGFARKRLVTLFN